MCWGWWRQRGGSRLCTRKIHSIQNEDSSSGGDGVCGGCFSWGGELFNAVLFLWKSGVPAGHGKTIDRSGGCRFLWLIPHNATHVKCLVLLKWWYLSSVACDKAVSAPDVPPCTCRVTRHRGCRTTRCVLAHLPRTSLSTASIQMEELVKKEGQKDVCMWVPFRRCIETTDKDLVICLRMWSPASLVLFPPAVLKPPCRLPQI